MTLATFELHLPKIVTNKALSKVKLHSSCSQLFVI